jgi:uncharacterized membrane protein YhaH (DUF805 family)
MKRSFHPFNARLDKRNYQIGVLLLLMVAILSLIGVTVLGNVLVTIDKNTIHLPQQLGISFAIVCLIYSILLVIIMNSLQTRRLHDMGYSYWSLKGNFTLPFFERGEPNKNLYGEKPDENFDLWKVFGFYRSEVEIKNENSL